MKTIRFLAAILLVITGVWHVTLFFKATSDPNSIPLLIFGILYGLIGVFLFTPKMLWVYLGLIFPLIGMTMASIQMGVKNFDLTMKVLILIDVIVIICCVYLILVRKKST
ncbi:MAG: hypothetical protein JW830_11050 [Bacteroidales bacterium]|nr:hypothetical protein [Bacteroidales bacterium]